MTPNPRLPLIDHARGAALIGMVVFHATFDLEMFGLIAPGTVTQPGWALFARLVAGSFVFLAGVSLVLAHGGGVRWTAFWRGTGIVALAALAITAVTRVAIPDAFIFFGVLHVIATCRVIGLGFLRAPAWALAVLAAAIFALAYGFAHPAFDSRWLAWIGFSQHVPFSMDLLPMFHWLAPFLAGMALARMGWIPRWSLPAPRALAWAGRRSLWIYLAHQPILIATLWLALQLWSVLA